MDLKRFSLVFSSILLVLMVSMYFMVFKVQQPERDIRAQYLKAGDFELQLNGEPFTLFSLRGEPVILYFGYTSCPDVCPVGLAVIRDVLKSSSEFSSVRTLFVTVDPLRDTPDVLKSYIGFFHPDILPLTGTIEDVKRVIEAYGGFMRHNPPTSSAQPDSYTVDHSAYYYLIDADSQLVRVLDHSVTAEEIATALRSLL
jgi:protein SCO1/2